MMIKENIDELEACLFRNVYFEPKRRHKNDYVNWKQKQYCELFDWGAKKTLKNINIFFVSLN